MAVLSGGAINLITCIYLNRNDSLIKIQAERDRNSRRQKRIKIRKIKENKHSKFKI